MKRDGNGEKAIPDGKKINNRTHFVNGRPTFLSLELFFLSSFVCTGFFLKKKKKNIFSFTQFIRQSRFPSVDYLLESNSNNYNNSSK